MQNAITTLHIQNFKSIKDVTMEPRRVNLIVGRPNVGKSNILEAMSLLGGMFFDREGGKFMDGQIRYEDMRNLFYDNDWGREIEVRGENFGATRVRSTNGVIEVAYGNGEEMPLSLAESLNVSASVISNAFAGILNKEGNEDTLVNFNRLNSFLGKCNSFGDVTEKKKKTVEESTLLAKKYAFLKSADYGQSYPKTYLRPPYGDNMLDVLQYNGAAFRKEIADMFRPYGLNFAMRLADRKFEIQKNEEGFITAIPYSLIADTLQRIIFYLAAIESNTDSVLLFEEPEAHSFPEYVTMLGRRIAESTENQFFVATHSPYLMNEIVEQMLPEEGQESELAIFVAYYGDYQTKVKQLSDEEIREIRNDSIDVFYNLSRFTPGSDLYA